MHCYIGPKTQNACIPRSNVGSTYVASAHATDFS